MDKIKITYFAPTSSMGDTSERDAAYFREWAFSRLSERLPDFDIEVSDEDALAHYHIGGEVSW